MHMILVISCLFTAFYFTQQHLSWFGNGHKPASLALQHSYCHDLFQYFPSYAVPKECGLYFSHARNKFSLRLSFSQAIFIALYICPWCSQHILNSSSSSVLPNVIGIHGSLQISASGVLDKFCRYSSMPLS